MIAAAPCLQPLLLLGRENGPELFPERVHRFRDLCALLLSQRLDPGFLFVGEIDAVEPSAAAREGPVIPAQAGTVRTEELPAAEPVAIVPGGPAGSEARAVAGVTIVPGGHPAVHVCAHCVVTMLAGGMTKQAELLLGREPRAGQAGPVVGVAGSLGGVPGVRGGGRGFFLRVRGQGADAEGGDAAEEEEGAEKFHVAAVWLKTPGPAVRYGRLVSRPAMARPASQPVVHAAWKLNPPVTPSMSSTSPAK